MRSRRIPPPPRYQAESTRIRRVLNNFHGSYRRPPSLGPVDVAAIRLRLGLSQRTFATRFGFPLTTLRHWEQEDRKPTGAALTLLHVIRENPRLVLETVLRIRNKIRWGPPKGSLPGDIPR